MCSYVKKTNMLIPFLWLSLLLLPVLGNPAANGEASNSSDPLSPKADEPFIPFGILSRNSTYDEEQV